MCKKNSRERLGKLTTVLSFPANASCVCKTLCVVENSAACSKAAVIVKPARSL